MYNASFMVLLWNSLASRDVRLMTRSLSKDYGIPSDGLWINYARCHDDIGWGFETDILRELGLDPEQHKQFMIRYMEGTFPGSFSVGELYEYNPVTKDARNSGTLASMCGLEQALNEKHMYKLELSVKRIMLLHGMIISYTGIPLLYSGDEIGQLNDWSYKEVPEIAGDSRWLHRGKMNWEAAEKRHDLSTVEGQIFSRMQQMISIRKSNACFNASCKAIPVDTWNPAVFGFHKGNQMLVLANFSEHEQWVDAKAFDWFGLPGEMHDLITGRPIRSYNNHIQLGPYEYLWLV
jgi:amylosucrase